MEIRLSSPRACQTAKIEAEKQRKNSKKCQLHSDTTVGRSVVRKGGKKGAP